MIHRVCNGRLARAEVDSLAVEEPLEIQVGCGDVPRQRRTVSITMRTPGNDRELAAGFLFTEGLLAGASDIAAILEQRNVIRVELAPGVSVDWPLLERHVYTSSSCGVCGKTSIDAVRRKIAELGREGPVLTPEFIASLPGKLRGTQSVFQATGGLHGSALYHFADGLVASYEDVGRHNAVDKVIGSCLLSGKIPLSDHALVVSGRASFELVQKAASAGIPAMVAVGAPSSLAVELAEEVGMTLAGFARDGAFNIYSVPSRIRESA